MEVIFFVVDLESLMDDGRKRPRHGENDVVVNVPADSEGAAEDLRALIDAVASELKKDGLIAEAEAGLAARHLFQTFSAGQKKKPAAAAPAVEQNLQDGSWVCECGNQNYPSRTICNMRSCGRPRPFSSNDHQSNLMLMQQQHQIQQPMMQPMMHAQQHQQVAFQQAHHSQGRVPEGSWVCESCSNLNYASRTFCNSHKCGRPRSLPPGGSQAMGQVAPSNMPPSHQHIPHGMGGSAEAGGNWTCPSCGNVNYPSRTVCNRHSCKVPRPAAYPDEQLGVFHPLH